MRQRRNEREETRREGSKEKNGTGRTVGRREGRKERTGNEKGRGSEGNVVADKRRRHHWRAASLNKTGRKEGGRTEEEGRITRKGGG